ncbi:uncharacterized protein LOC114378935 [Glycine soja]|uniref:uncharacterized protein LOC114378935 n=1 Tax=Glycine soja TaxID=3848 RepID=UPI0010406891|nr:uncharacterized protein LOC114378935 [Glycine soja]
MTKATAWARITAYMAENRLNTAFEAESQQNMAVEAKIEDHENKETKDRRLDCIYDDEPLGFEKNPISEVPKMQAQDPLEEIDIGNGSIKRPTYISANITSSLKEKLVPLLREFKDCFAWDYHEMPGLSREMVEMKLPIKEGKRPVKQLPRRFAPEIMSKIKEEIERLLRCKFIRSARYVEWLANIVPVIKKNGTLRVCIDFRDLNNATPKDEYAMPVAEMLVDSAAGFEFLSMLDGYSGYNQIFIAESDVSKTAFRCPGDFLGFVVHKKGIEINQNKTKAILETKPPSTKKQLQSLLGKINFLRRFISNLSGKAQIFSPLLRLKKDEPFEWNEEHQKAFDEIKEYLIKPPVLMPPSRNKTMKLYIAASDKTIGSMLAQEDDDGIEHAIYYLSRVLNNAETRYTAIEKLCLCLYFSCAKLKQYIKPVDVYVYSHYDIIKHMLSKPILHSRIGKWALALTEYSLTYKPLKSVKGQIVADFIVDHSVIEMSQDYVDTEPWILYFDGLEILINLGARNVNIRGDSELVLKQLTQEYKCVNEHLAKYFVMASSLLNHFDYINIEHIPRQENQEANDLAQIASGYKMSKEKLTQLIEIKDKLVLPEPLSTKLPMPKLVGASIPQNNEDESMDDLQERIQILAIDNMLDNDWRKSIVEYLENPIGNVARKIKYRALNYVIVGNDLFKKTAEGVLLKCLSESEAYLAVSHVHSGACGSHQAGHKMKWLLFRQGLYWPSMLKDCIEFAKGCQECQKHAGI